MYLSNSQTADLLVAMEATIYLKHPLIGFLKILVLYFSFSSPSVQTFSFIQHTSFLSLPDEIGHIASLGGFGPLSLAKMDAVRATSIVHCSFKKVDPFNPKELRWFTPPPPHHQLHTPLSFFFRNVLTSCCGGRWWGGGVVIVGV